jgi:4-amino-4-deoxy-L-arabinose transferase-like glycosyltransferase
VAFAVPVVAATLLRARFLTAPLTVDEGGYLAVARAWGRGSHLYDEVWVDRPQGLLVLYRSLHAVGIGTPLGVRLAGLVACIVAALACGHIAARLVGERARLVTGLVVAVVASLPHIEGHTANAELLSASLGAASLALCLEACHRAIGRSRWLLAAGVVGGAALTVKQSAFDALGAAFVAVVLVGLAGTTRRQRVRAGGLLAMGAALPIGLCAVHGALTGWQRWWYAVAGYRLSQRSALVDAHFDRIGVVWEVVRPASIVLAAVVVVGLVCGLTASSASRRATAVLAAWGAIALVAFVLGGQFFRHYWTILAIPAATAAGATIGAVRTQLGRVVLVGAVLAGPVVVAIDAMSLPRGEIGPRLHDDVRLVQSEQVAQWFTDEAQPGDELYVMCVSAAVYGNGDIDPPYPYLWWDGVRQIPGAGDLLAAMLDDAGRPRFLAVFQTPESCDPSGRVDELVRQHYARRTVVDGVAILEVRP